MFRFILAPLGSSGDVFPFIGVGRELRRRGYDVVLVTARHFRDAAKSAGLGFAEVLTEEEFHYATDNPDVWHPLKGPGILCRWAAHTYERTYEQLDALYRPGQSALVEHALAWGARTFDEHRGAPAMTLHLQPSVLRSDYEQPAAHPAFTLSRFPKPIKRFVWGVFDHLIIGPNAEPALNAWRSRLRLPPVRQPFRDWMHAPRGIVALFPDWFGARQPDWHDDWYNTGFPLFDTPGEQPSDPELDAWIAEGEPPIVATPGTANQFAERFFRAVIDAAERLNRRALLLTGFERHLPTPLPGHVRYRSFLPLSQWLPKAAAIVHHGGIGTSAQGLAAGIPHLVMPMAYDQPDHAARLRRLGVGHWVMPHHFSGKRVARRLQYLLEHQSVAERCRHWMKQIQRQDAIVETCDLLERMVS